MTIAKVESHSIGNGYVSRYYRITRGEAVEKAYNRFKNHLRESIGFGEDLPKGVIGKDPDALPNDRSIIKGDLYCINVIRSENYMHIVAVMNNKVTKEFVKALKFFHASKKSI